MHFGHSKESVNNCMELFHYIYNRMKEQNGAQDGHFTIERFSQKGPFYLNPHQRVAHLQNKVTFYEGQLDPLHSENSVAKQNYINLARIVSISTEILRNLLPVGNNPAKKLKLEMASIDEIAKMIEIDWKEMEQTITSLQADQKQLQIEIKDWQHRLKREQQCRIKKVKQLQDSILQLKSNYQHQIQNLQQQASKAKTDLDRLKSQAYEEHALKDKLIDSVNRQLQLLKREMECKCNDYQRCIARLNAQMENNLLEFEESKKMVKQICEKMMNEKLTEQAEAYQMMLKMKDDEKFMLQVSINELVEEHNQKIKLKDDEIQAINAINYAKRAEIKNLEDELYKKKEELMKQIKDNKDLQTQLLRTKEKNQSLSERVSKQEKTIQQQIEKIKVTIEKYEQDLKLMKTKGNQAVNKLLEEKMQLQRVILVQDKELKETKETLEKVEEQFNWKMENAKQTWLQKESQYTAQIAKNIKKIQEEKQRVRRVKEEREKELESIGKQHMQLLKRLEKQFQQSKEDYIRQQTIKLRQMIDQNEEQIIKIKMNHKKELQMEMYKMEEKIKQKSAEFEKKMAEKQKIFEAERRKYEEQIQVVKMQEQLLCQKLTKAREQALEQEAQMEKLKIDQLKALKKLELENQINNKKWQEMIEKQMQSFLKELEIKQSQISSLQEKFSQQRQQFEKKLSSKDAQLVSMKEHMEREINSLKDTNGMMEMENKYKSELAALKDSLTNKLIQAEQIYRKQIRNIKDLHQRETQHLIQNYDQKIAETHNNFQRVLVALGSQFQKKSTFFNENYLNEDVDSQLQGLSQQDKLAFIRCKMEESIKLSVEKDNEIANLQKQLQRFEKKIQEQMMLRRKQLEIEKTNIINDCNRKLTKKEEECRQRVQAVQRDRKIFSQDLFKQFKTMKQNYESQLFSLNRKYKELEELFSVRPSRAEDVTKIKELISIQTKLDQEIIIYHKKMETANQIVKYLNLELENYKQTYDIFGPADTALHNKTISFTEDSHKMMEYYKQRQLQKAKQERQHIFLDRRNVESPQIRELRIFNEKEEQHSESIVIEPKQPVGRSRKYSLIPDKLPPARDRIKTEKVVDREGELMDHAATFMKLIKKANQDVSIVKELQINEDSKKRTYRRRKLKRLTTGVVEHYF